MSSFFHFSSVKSKNTLILRQILDSTKNSGRPVRDARCQLPKVWRRKMARPSRAMSARLVPAHASPGRHSSGTDLKILIFTPYPHLNTSIGFDVRASLYTRTEMVTVNTAATTFQGHQTSNRYERPYHNAVTGTQHSAVTTMWRQAILFAAVMSSPFQRERPNLIIEYHRNKPVSIFVGEFRSEVQY